MTSFDVGAYRARAAELGAAQTEIHALAETTSTNDLALAAARAGARSGTIFVADTQTRGRGRQGRTWFAEPGESLLASVVLRPRLSLTAAPPLALVVGLTLRAVAAELLGGSRAVAVKWPNDVWCEDKKLAGVLIETQVQGDALNAAIVGMGLNLRTERFPEPLAATATSLAALGARGVSRERALAAIAAKLVPAVARYERLGLEPFLAELAAHDALRGSRVRVDDLAGTAEGIDSSGRLIVRDELGVARALTSGHVERV